MAQTGGDMDRLARLLERNGQSALAADLRSRISGPSGSASSGGRVTGYLAHNKIQLEVAPPYVHHLNGHAEEMVHSQTKGMRVRLPSLKGVDAKGGMFTIMSVNGCSLTST